MKQFQILSNSFLSRDVKALCHEDYLGGGRFRVTGTIENLICTLKNDIPPYPSAIELQNACNNLSHILRVELPEILMMSEKTLLRVCVIPRAKKEDLYALNQLYLRATIQSVVQSLPGLEDGTHDIIRHTNTRTTHRNKSGHGGDGKMPYPGITKDTCTLSDEIIGKDILLIDDLYTKTVNIDEDCLQALIDKGARSVFFYSIGKTINRF
jgi:hypothetical protein